jgi:SAM-dependent methyltransferase
VKIFPLFFKQAGLMIIAEKMKQDWNQRARHHARFWIATEDYQTEEKFAQSGKDTAQALLATLSGLHQASWKVLDLGCGIGRVLKALAPHFHQLFGVDVSNVMIAQSKIWLADYPHIQTRETSGVDLREFPDSYFDLVYSYVTFQHVPRPVFERYLGEIHRVLTPSGYLAFQLPIGPFRDAPFEDTIGIRSYPIQEIEESLRRNGLGVLNHTPSDHKITNLSDPLSHRFRLAQKIGSRGPVASVDLGELERPHFVSELDTHLYAVYADDCVRAGNHHEGFRTLQTLVNKNPDDVAGWLRLATLLIETGQFQKALYTLKDLTTLHPWYQEGQITFQNMLKKCAAQRTGNFTSLPTDDQNTETQQSPNTPDHSNNEFFVR